MLALIEGRQGYVNANSKHHAPLSDLRGLGEVRAYMPDLLRHRRAEHVSQGPVKFKRCAYKFSAVRVGVSLNEVIDVSVSHPFRNHRESLLS